MSSVHIDWTSNCEVEDDEENARRFISDIIEATNPNNTLIDNSKSASVSKNNNNSNMKPPLATTVGTSASMTRTPSTLQNAWRRIPLSVFREEGKEGIIYHSREINHENHDSPVSLLLSRFESARRQSTAYSRGTSSMTVQVRGLLDDYFDLSAAWWIATPSSSSDIQHNLFHTLSVFCEIAERELEVVTSSTPCRELGDTTWGLRPSGLVVYIWKSEQDALVMKHAWEAVFKRTSLLFFSSDRPIIGCHAPPIGFFYFRGYIATTMPMLHWQRISFASLMDPFAACHSLRFFEWELSTTGELFRLGDRMLMWPLPPSSSFRDNSASTNIITRFHSLVRCAIRNYESVPSLTRGGGGGSSAADVPEKELRHGFTHVLLKNIVLRRRRKWVQLLYNNNDNNTDISVDTVLEIVRTATVGYDQMIPFNLSFCQKRADIGRHQPDVLLCDDLLLCSPLQLYIKFLRQSFFYNEGNEKQASYLQAAESLLRSELMRGTTTSCSMDEFLFVTLLTNYHFAFITKSLISDAANSSLLHSIGIDLCSTLGHTSELSHVAPSITGRALSLFRYVTHPQCILSATELIQGTRQHSMGTTSAVLTAFQHALVQEEDSGDEEGYDVFTSTNRNHDVDDWDALFDDEHSTIGAALTHLELLHSPKSSFSLHIANNDVGLSLIEALEHNNNGLISLKAIWHRQGTPDGDCAQRFDVMRRIINACRYDESSSSSNYLYQHHKHIAHNMKIVDFVSTGRLLSFSKDDKTNNNNN
eukprot:PhM_4_TR15922/c3_g1_i1/m.11344